MPSGAKKRKAAKKKNQSINNNPTPSSSTPHSLGEKDLKSIDEKEKESDGGEVSSPASQDHNIHQHPFTDREDEEVEKREDTSSVRPFVSESYGGENLQGAAAGEGEGVVRIERELKSKEDFESKNVMTEWGKELHDGSSLGSPSSSSSDDEPRVLDKKIVVVETAPPIDSVKLVDSSSEVVTQVHDSVPIGEVNHLVKETDSSVHSTKVSLLEQVVNVNESVSIDSSKNSGVVVGSDLKENGKKRLLSLDENIRASPVMDFGSHKEEEEVVSASNEYPASSLDANDPSAAQVNEDRPLLSVNASKVGTSNGKEHAKYSETPDCSANQPLIGSAPQPVQTTSWKSCCGIFELFTGSNR